MSRGTPQNINCASLQISFRAVPIVVTGSLISSNVYKDPPSVKWILTGICMSFSESSKIL